MHPRMEFDVEACVEQALLAAGFAAAYMALPPACHAHDSRPTELKRKRKRGGRRRCLAADADDCSVDSLNDSAMAEHAAVAMRRRFDRRRMLPALVILWLLAAVGLEAYRTLAYLHLQHCSGSLLKWMLQVIQPGRCAAYAQYMHYLKSAAYAAAFGVLSAAWRYCGFSWDRVIEVQESLANLQDTLGRHQQQRQHLAPVAPQQQSMVPFNAHHHVH